MTTSLFTTRPSTDRDVCARNNDHDLPATVVEYDDPVASRGTGRVVCDEVCADALTDEIVRNMP